MRLADLPKRLGIIGGGFIAAEMGHVFAALGSDVTMVARSTGLLRGFDEEIAQRFTEVFGTRVDLRLGTAPTSVRRVSDGIEITVGEATIVVDELLVATGREPNSDLLDAAAGGLELGEHGTIKVDDTMATNVDGVWAIGDIANTYQLKHLANAEAKVAFWNIAHPDDQHHQSYKAVPSAVFSNPQIATVGLTEARGEGAGPAVRRRRPRVRGNRVRMGARRHDIVRQGARELRNGLDHRRPHHRSAGGVADPAARAGDGVRPAGRRCRQRRLLHPPCVDRGGGERAPRSGRPTDVTATSHADALELSDAEIEHARAITPGCVQGPRRIHLNHAGCSLPPLPVVDAQIDVPAA